MFKPYNIGSRETVRFIFRPELRILKKLISGSVLFNNNNVIGSIEIEKKYLETYLELLVTKVGPILKEVVRAN